MCKDKNEQPSPKPDTGQQQGTPQKPEKRPIRIIKDDKTPKN